VRPSRRTLLAALAALLLVCFLLAVMFFVTPTTQTRCDHMS
jgi:hypothetical protein